MVDKYFVKDILQKKLLDEADIGDMEDTNSDRYEKRPQGSGPKKLLF